MKYFLGLEIASSSFGLCPCQRKHTIQLLEDTGYTNCKPQAIPMNPNLPLTDSEGELLPEPSQYRRLLGTILWFLTMILVYLVAFQVKCKKES